MMKRIFTRFLAAVALLTFMTPAMSAFADNASYVFNTDAGIAALGITKPSAGTGTSLSTTSPYVVGQISMSVTHGSTDTRVWNSNGTLDLRIYKNGGTLTFNAATGYNITAISITGNTTNIFNVNVGSYSNGSWSNGNTGASSVTFTATNTGKINTITITYEAAGGSTTIPTTVTIDDTNLTNTDVYNSTEAGSLSAIVKDNNNSPISGAAVTWTSSATNVATIDDNGVVTLVAAGTTTITASYAGDATYGSSSETYNLEVTNSEPTPDYEWVLADLANLTPNDVFVIVGTVSNSSYSMSNNSDSNPVASAVTIENGKITSTIADNLKWNVSGNATDGYTFYPNGSTTTWLYCNTTANSGSNTNLRVGGGNNATRKLFIPEGTTLKTKDSNTARYWNVYSSGPDWRGYVSNSTSTTVTFYKRQIASTDPAINAANVDIAYDATEGSIGFTIDNPVSTATVVASVPEGSWLNLGTVGENSVPFTCDANSAHSQRSTTVTLSYENGEETLATKDVTVTQAAAPVIYTTIPEIFAAATGTETEVLITFNNWVVSGVSTNGKNVFVTDNEGHGFVIFSSSDMSNTYAAGNILSGTAVTCTLLLYNGFAELKNVNASDLTITGGGTVTVADIEMANLAGVNTGALLHYENLTCSIDNNKYYLSDGTTTLQVYNALFAFGALTSGKTYNITGVYQQFNNTKEILPRSADDIEEVQSTVPSITLEEYNIEFTYESSSAFVDVTYANLDNVDGFIVKCYSDANATQSIETPEWLISAEVNQQQGAWRLYLAVSANDGAARTAYFKVQATTAGVPTDVYSDLATVTQAAAPVIYTTIPELFAAATGTETSILVTFNNWVVSGVSTNGKNVFVTDNNGNGFVIFDNNGGLGDSYSVGNILTGTGISCTLLLYNGFAELKNVNDSDLTITEGGTVTVADIEMANLAGVNTGALVHYDNLTCSIDNNKYYLSDGTTTLQVYNALYTFDALTAGSTYNITGVYQQFNNTKEILPRSAADIEEVTSTEPSVTVTPNTINAPFAGADGTLALTYENIPDLISFDYYFCDAEGNELEDTDPAYPGDWIDAVIIEPTPTEENYTVYYDIDANDGAARTAYFKVYTPEAENVFALVTVNQAEYVIDYATLPFEWNSNYGTAPTGVTNSGVGTGGSGTGAYLKFDSTDDYIILKINDRPGTLTYNIKANPSDNTWDGVFKVQASENGTDYSDVVVYDENNMLDLSDFHPATINTFGENVRYIKWIYTNKVKGNVAVNNISLAEYETPAPAITVDPSLVEATAAGGDGTLSITLSNMTISDDDQLDIVYYYATGEQITNQEDIPNWLECIITGDNESYVVYYSIGQNMNPEAQTTYIKVYGVDDDGTSEAYSNLVTVSQEAYVAPVATITLVNTSSDPEANPYLVELSYGAQGGNAAGVDIANFEVAGASSFSIYFCDENGDAIPAQPEWITCEVVGAYDWFHWAPYVLTYSVVANDGEARAAYFKILAYNNNDAVYSDLITVTQAAYVAPVTTGTISFGNNGIKINSTLVTGDDSMGNTWTITTVGTTSFTQNADYSQVGKSAEPATNITFTTTLPVSAVVSSFEAKFGGFNNTAGNITLKVGDATVGTGSLNGTSDVTVSNTTTATGTVLTVTVTNIAKGVKCYYISYTLGEPSTDPYINLVAYNPDYTNPYLVELPVGPTPESEVTWYHATVEYGNFQVTDLNAFQFQFYNEQGLPINQPDWIMLCEVTSEFTWIPISNVLYVSAHANTGLERWAYFKVYANISDTDAVYSDLVTVHQAAAPQSYDLTVTLGEHVNAIFVFDDPNGEPLIENGAAGTVQVLEGTNIIVSPDVAEGYVLEELLINNDNVISQLDESGAYTFTMTGLVAISATAVEAPVTTNYTLATSIESGRHYIITNGSNKAMGAQSVTTTGSQGNNRTAVEITTVGNVAQVASDEVVEFVINGPDGNGFYTIYDAEFPGYLYASGGTSSNHLKTQTFCDNRGQWTISFNADNTASIVANISGNNARNRMQYNDNNDIFSCYSGGQQAVYLYLKNEETPQYDFYKDIAGYGSSAGKYYLIASPIDDADPIAAGMITDELGAQVTPETSTYDFYWFDQTQSAEWQNYRQVDNGFKLVSGMGYLYANKTNRTIHFNGTPSDNATVSLVKDDDADFAGWNLVGNPLGKVAYIDRDFYVMKADGTEIVTAERGNNYINPMEGVFVIAESNDEELVFYPEPILSKNAKISMNLGNGRGNVIDRAIVRFEEGGMLPKFMLNPGNTKLYIPQGLKDYAVVRSANEGEMPVNFKAAENGTYTLNVEAKNVEMNYLHLIDNRTGADVDLLANPNYTFEANKGDNANRFKLVFKAGTGIEEYNATETFAYFNGSAWVISNTGDATLQVIDMMGRVLRSEQINGNTAVNINETAGIYMLRLVNGENVMVQKVVVK